jgi:hypothetical protein
MVKPRPPNIYVPGLRKDGEIIIPDIWLGTYVLYRNRVGNYLRVDDHQKRNPPTLAELVHAFFNDTDGQPIIWEKHGDRYRPSNNDYVSHQYRQSVHSKRQGRFHGEWTATFRQPRAPNRGEVVPRGYRPIRLIERPEKIEYNEEGLAIAEYSSKNSFDTLEPSIGWVTKYMKETGYPEETSMDREDAAKIFGGDTSYFSVGMGRGLRVVSRYFSAGDRGPFYVYVLYKPDGWDQNIGSRPSCASEKELRFLRRQDRLLGSSLVS